jgi:23S rRNA (cytosine1962-C5)-methyltransferase
VLNLFSYSGAFSVAALAGGASRAVDVDSSAAALVLARAHRRENGFPAEGADFVEADVFEDLRRRVSARERWDVVVCDPPAFAKKKSDVERAARGYKDVNRLAMTLVAPGGWLLTCSCSGLVDAALFQKIVFSASAEARAAFALAARQGAGPDHPVSLDCPEGEYLKGLWMRRSS